MSLISQIHAARSLALSGRAEEGLALLQDLGDLDFPTFHIVRGECYYTLKQFGQARDEFRNALLLSPNSPRAEILLRLSTEMAGLERSMRPLPGIDQLVQPTGSGGTRLPSITPTEPPEATDSKITEDGTPTSADEMGLVSETLATIMIRQGKFEEARKVYIQLARKNPDRYEYFRQRMDELDERIRG
jgi:tetratricopeptide (TPR) repeat protein